MRNKERFEVVKWLSVFLPRDNGDAVGAYLLLRLTGKSVRRWMRLNTASPVNFDTEGPKRACLLLSNARVDVP